MSGQLASDYSPQSLSRVKATCLTVAQVLGDEMVDETVIVGGVVPSLLFADVEPDPDIGEHVGTLDLGHRYRMRIVLSGADLSGRYVERSIPLCRPDIFILLKALALKYRDKAKDAYDIHFVLKHYADGPQSLGHQLGMLPSHDTRLEMVESLERDYMSVNTRGPQMVCSFLARDDDDLAADALAQVRAFLAGFHG